LLARSADIEAAVIADLPQPATSGQPREVMWSCGAIDQTLEHLDDWVRAESWEASPWLSGTQPSVEYEARGVCLVFGPWNVPFAPCDRADRGRSGGWQHGDGQAEQPDSGDLSDRG
jgi:aldehyde dehydrogenase (NAD+)